MAEGVRAFSLEKSGEKTKVDDQSPENEGQNVEKFEPIENASELYGEVEIMNNDIFPQLEKLIADHIQKSEFSHGEVFEKRVDVIFDKVMGLKILDIDEHTKYSNDPDLKSNIKHDVNDLVNGVIQRMGSWKDGLEPSLKDKIKLLTTLSGRWPEIYYSLKNALTVKLEEDPEFVPENEILESELADKSLRNFAVDSSINQRRRTRPGETLGTPIDILGDFSRFQDILEADETVGVRSSLLMNSIFNVLRNACTEHVDAKGRGISLKIRKEGKDLVIQVIDNGIGLSGEQLEPKNERFIFNKGEKKSERGSTGLGLADLDKRMEKAGGMLRVASRKRGDQVEQMVVYPPSINETEKDDFKTTLQTGDNSTIFEWRLPINKKELAA